jgi:biotin carboxylase
MRSLLKENGVRVPAFNLHHLPTHDKADIERVEELAKEISYPAVIKPLTLSGSRGVIRINDQSEFTRALWRLRQIILTYEVAEDPIPFLVETYIDGWEIALEGLLDDGQLHVLAMFDKPDPLTGPYFEETIYVTPSRQPKEMHETAASCTANAAAALGLRDGPVHAELRLNEAGPWLIEIASRSIGGLCSQSLRFGLDSSLEELIIRQAMGFEITSYQRESAASGVMMIPIPSRGILRGASGIEEAKGIPLIEEVEITARINYSLVPLPEGDSYLGFIFARGDSPAEVESALRQAHSKLRFDISPELNLSPDSQYFTPRS